MKYDKSVDVAADNIKTIRDILTRTMSSYKKLAPSYMKLGIIWTIYALITALLILFDFTGLLNSPSGSLHTILSYTLLGCEIVFCLVLVGVYYKWGKASSDTDFSLMTKKLVYLWRVFILVFAVFKLFMLTVYPAFVGYFSSMQTVELASGVIYGNIYVLGFLPVIFPAIPLILTSNFLEKKNMAVLGITVLITSAIWMVLMMLVVDASSVNTATTAIKFIVSLLIRLTPAVSLFALSIQLKNKM